MPSAGRMDRTVAVGVAVGVAWHTGRVDTVAFDNRFPVACRLISPGRFRCALGIDEIFDLLPLALVIFQFLEVNVCSLKSNRIVDRVLVGLLLRLLLGRYGRFVCSYEEELDIVY